LHEPLRERLRQASCTAPEVERTTFGANCESQVTRTLRDPRDLGSPELEELALIPPAPFFARLGQNRPERIDASEVLPGPPTSSSAEARSRVSSPASISLFVSIAVA
jgi:hypothetical protein